MIEPHATLPPLSTTKCRHCGGTAVIGYQCRGACWADLAATSTHDHFRCLTCSVEWTMPVDPRRPRGG